MKSTKKLFAILTLVVFMMTLLPMSAFAASTLTATTATITVSGASTATAGNIVLTEAAAGDIAAGNVVLTAPAGITFDTTATVTAAVTGGGTLAATAPTVANGGLTASTITIPTTGASAAAGTLTIGGIKVISTVAGVYNITITGGGLAAAGNAIVATFDVQGNRYASTFAVDKTTAIADGSDYIESTVYISNGTPQPGQEVIITTNRGAIDTSATADAAKYPTVGGFVTTGTSNNGVQGKAIIRTTSTTKGSAKLAVAVSYTSYAAGVPLALGGLAGHQTAVQAYLNGDTTYTADELQIISTQDITFASPAAGTVTISNNGPKVADGLTEATVTVVVLNGVTPVSGEKVTFSVNKTGLSFDKTEYTTDAMGIVNAKVTATKASTYEITATAGGKNSAANNLVFSASLTPYNIELMKETTTPIAKTYLAEKIIKVKVTDINGNKMSTVTVPAMVTPSIKSKPTGSTAAIPVLTPAANTDVDGYFQYDFTPDKVGTYVLRFALANGKYVETSVESQTIGTITSLTISYDTKSLYIPSAGINTSAVPTVKQLDADGVARTAVGTIQYSTSNPNVAVANANGSIKTATVDAKDAQVITITAVDTTNNLVATTTMPVVGPATTLTAAVSGKVAVNTNATVTLTFKDVNGNTVALNAAPTNAYSIISKPAGAGVNVSYAANAATEFTNKGVATATVNSTVAGKVTVIFRVTDAAGTIYTATADVEVAAAQVVVGAKAVTMFIGATGFVQDSVAKVSDVAPFIQDGRTFVAVRPIADAFGATIGWNEATQTVTLTRTDMTLTIVIGSNTITKVAGGVTSTSTADVPAFIKDGRTVLPFRAVGEAFGATVSYDAATQAVSFVQ